MEFLLNPNFVYILLVSGVFMGLLALVSPGTGFLEISALFVLVLGGYALYNLSFHWWALLILIASLIPFFYAMRNIRRNQMLVLSITGIILGSVFLFPGQDGTLLGVSPLVALFVSLMAGSFLWIGLNKGLEAHYARPAHDLDALVGRIGEAKTDIFESGSAQVAGELWTARSDKKIPAGSVILVLNREGFTLVVEKSKQSK